MDEQSPIHPPAPIDVSDLFPELLRNLISLLADLSEEEWNLPTVCPGWAVKDIALHMLGVDVGNLSLRRDGFSDPWWNTSGADFVSMLNRFNENWVVAARRISPRLLCEFLAFTGDAAGRYYSSLNTEAIGGPVTWAGPEPAPIWLDVAREYTERWVHQQQIRDAVGRPGLKDPRYLAPVLAAFVHALPYALRHVAMPLGTVVRLIITGEAGGRWLAVRGTRGWQLGQDSGAAAAATVTIGQETAWRVWTRGISRDEARTRVRVEGSPDLTESVLEMVSIIA